MIEKMKKKGQIGIAGLNPLLSVILLISIAFIVAEGTGIIDLVDGFPPGEPDGDTGIKLGYVDEDGNHVDFSDEPVTFDYLINGGGGGTDDGDGADYFYGKLYVKAVATQDGETVDETVRIEAEIKITLSDGTVVEEYTETNDQFSGSRSMVKNATVDAAKVRDSVDVGETDELTWEADITASWSGNSETDSVSKSMDIERESEESLEISDAYWELGEAMIIEG